MGISVGRLQDLGIFRWYVPTKGYYWDKEAFPVDGINHVYSSLFSSRAAAELKQIKEEGKESDFLTFLIESPETEKFEAYDPLEKKTTLFLDFANLCPGNKKENILKFANKYGRLTKKGLFPVFAPNFSVDIKDAEATPFRKPVWWDTFNATEEKNSKLYVYLPGESLSFWINEARQMKRVTLLWQWLKESKENNSETAKDNLRMAIRWSEDNEYIYYYLATEKELIDYPLSMKKEPPKLEPVETGTLKLSTDHENKEIFDQFKPGDLCLPAQYIIREKINEKLNQYTSIPRLLWNEKNLLMHYIVPSSLLAAMWFQFYQAMTGEKKIKWCSLCGCPEDVTNKKSNWTKHPYCANSFRVRKHRGISAIIAGKKTESDVASELNIPLGEVQKLVGDKKRS